MANNTVRIRRKNHPRADRIAVADVQAVTDAIEKTGKKTRDTIANNVNHSNDFIIRLYAQVILKTVFGSEYVSETYKNNLLEEKT